MTQNTGRQEQDGQERDEASGKGSGQESAQGSDAREPILLQHPVQQQDALLRALIGQRHSEKLGALVKRNSFRLPAKAQIAVGWAQLPRLHGTMIALGVFPDKEHFCQIALADWHGRVFLTPEAQSQAQGLTTDFAFLPERTAAVRSVPRPQPASRSAARPGAADGSSADPSLRPNAPVPVVRPSAKRLFGRFAQAIRSTADEAGRTLRTAARKADRAVSAQAGIGVDGGAIGMASNPMAQPAAQIPAGSTVFGAMISSLDPAAQDDPRWVASWTQRGTRYDLHEMKMPLPSSLRHDLSYRDAVAIGFFAAGYLPWVDGHPQGYGSGALFRYLHEQSPITAIQNARRQIVADALAGFDTSDLALYFFQMPEEMGLDPAAIAPLMPTHGLEPLYIGISAYSHSFQLHSRVPRGMSNGVLQPGELNMVGEFQALRLESMLNRFSLLSQLLETNAITGSHPVEETVSLPQLRTMNQDILRDPILTALPVPGSSLWRGQNTAFDDEGTLAVSGPHPDLGSYLLSSMEFADSTTRALMEREKKAGRHCEWAGEWVYRQSLSRLFEMLRLPMRLTADFRASLRPRADRALGAFGRAIPSIRLDDASTDHRSGGSVAIEMGAVETGLLPDKFFASGRSYPATDADKKALASRESLEEGLMLAALAFGASEDVERVTLLINDAGLTHYVQERSAQTGHGLLEQVGILLHGSDRSDKGEAKDKDRHGDPSVAPIVPDDAPFAGNPLDRAAGDELEHPTVTDSHGNVFHPFGTDGDEADQDQEGKNLEDHPEDPDKDSDKQGDSGQEDRPDSRDSSDSAADSADGIEADGDGADGMDAATARQAAEIFAASQPDQNLPEPVRLVTVTFSREKFLSMIRSRAGRGDFDLFAFYEQSAAAMRTDGNGALMPTASQVSLRDLDYTPAAAQEEPEAAGRSFDARARRVLAAKDSLGLSIQREEVLESAVDFIKQMHREEQEGHTASAQAARRASAYIDRIADPELNENREELLRALIDKTDIPDVSFEDEKKLHDERMSLLHTAMGGMDPRQALQDYEQLLARYDARYRQGPGVPRFFNSYAERVVYNHLFATPGEKTLIIPDDLFYGHLLLAEAYGDFSEQGAALRHLNRAVSYAPSYAMVHLRQSVQLARSGDWAGARAACMNALNVAVDRLDAGYAYYRLAFTEWQLDRFVPAAACYRMAMTLGQDADGAAQDEFAELSRRMHLLGIQVPQSDEEISAALQADSIPGWPDRQILVILERATHVCVDEGMFIPARTIARAWTRVSHSHQDGIDMVQSRFLRTLEA